MKRSQKISLLSLAVASVAVVIAASREPKVQAALKDAQVNLGKWYNTNVTPFTKELNLQKIGLTL